MGKPHRVFLSRQAVELLRQVHELTGHGEYVFPSIFRGSVPMGDVTLNHFFKRIDFGVPDFSPHGLRGTAATLLREHGFGRDVVELRGARRAASRVRWRRSAPALDLARSAKASGSVAAAYARSCTKRLISHTHEFSSACHVRTGAVH